MNFTPATREEIVKRLANNEPVYVYRTTDMCPFEVTGVGRNSFVRLDRHGVEHAREFSGRWLLEATTKEVALREVSLREAREERLKVRMDILKERVQS